MTDDGRAYFIDHNTRTTSWTAPNEQPPVATLICGDTPNGGGSSGNGNGNGASVPLAVVEAVDATAFSDTHIVYDARGEPVDSVRSSGASTTLPSPPAPTMRRFPWGSTMSVSSSQSSITLPSTRHPPAATPVPPPAAMSPPHRSDDPHGATILPYRVPDTYRPGCHKCDSVFMPPFAVRNHCRSCGEVYCARCASHKASVPLPTDECRAGPVKVCDFCHSVLAPGSPALGVGPAAQVDQ